MKTTQTSSPVVRPGQIWSDNDPRANGRRLYVESVVFGPYPYARCLSYYGTRVKGQERPTRISLNRFNQNRRSGYTLVREARAVA